MLRVVATFVPLLLFACHSDSQSASDQVESWIIKGVGIVDTRNGIVLHDRSVVIEGNRIASLGPSANVVTPPGAKLIDGAGKFLIPGLWDAHIHTSDDAETRNAVLPLLIANGVTGARSMAADCHSQDVKRLAECGPTIYDVNKWRQEIAAGTLVGPRLVAASYYTDGPDNLEESTIDNPGTAEHARAYARLLNDRGVDLIKVYSGMYREAYFAMAEEARSLGLEFGGHVPIKVRVSEASNAGQSTIEHSTGFLEECSADEERLRPKLVASYSRPAEFWSVLIELAETFDDRNCPQLYEHLASNGTWHVPTLSTDGFYTGLESPRGEWRDDPNLKYVPRMEAEMWEGLERDYFEGIENYKQVLQPFYRKSFEITRDTHRAGVPMMAGSDAGEFGIIWGFSLHDELQYLVEAGLTNVEALRAATLSPARYRGMEGQLGTIEEGKLADLVLLNANPLDDISNTQAIETVIANGRVFTRDDLDGIFHNVEVYVRSTWGEDISTTE